MPAPIGKSCRARVTALVLIVAAALAAPTGAAAQICGGDCNLDGQVVVNELVLGVSIALGSDRISACPAMDANYERNVTVNELISAVGHALDGCPPITCTAPPGGRCVTISPGPDAQDALLTALIEAQPNDVIFVEEGRYDIDGQLSLDVDNVTIRGAGQNRTILSFRNLTVGAEGLLVQANHFTLQDIALEDAPGDLFKALGVDGLRVQRVRTEWTTGADPDNGAYGIYPVQCKDVLVEDSIARGASDTGIYVGQSRNIIVRRNTAELNVSGVEIENSVGADVYDNTARHNAAGVTVFNLPDLPVFGARTRIFDNTIEANNTTSFSPSGNSVTYAPTGSGVVVLANDSVEVFGNTFRDNNTAHVIALSFPSLEPLAGVPPPADPNFDPYTESTYIHDNTYVGGGTMPPPYLQFVVDLLGGLPVPQIVYDGYVDPAKLVGGSLPAALRTCIQESDATFANLNVETFHTVPNITRDLAPFNCSQPALPPIAIPGVP